MALTFTSHLPSPTIRTMHKDLGFKSSSRKIPSHKNRGSLKNNPNQPLLKPKDQLREREGWKVEDVVSHICRSAKQNRLLETEQPCLTSSGWCCGGATKRILNLCSRLTLDGTMEQWVAGHGTRAAMSLSPAESVPTYMMTCTGGGAAGCQRSSVCHLLHDLWEHYAYENQCRNP